MDEQYLLYSGIVLDRANPDAQNERVYVPARNELEARKLLTSLNYSSIKVESLNGKSRLMTSIGLLTRGAKTALSRLTSRLTSKRNAGKRNKLKKIKATKRRH